MPENTVEVMETTAKEAVEAAAEGKVLKAVIFGAGVLTGIAVPVIVKKGVNKLKNRKANKPPKMVAVPATPAPVEAPTK